jgi:hypothetical protein
VSIRVRGLEIEVSIVKYRQALDVLDYPHLILYVENLRTKSLESRGLILNFYVCSCQLQANDLLFYSSSAAITPSVTTARSMVRCQSYKTFFPVTHLATNKRWFLTVHRLVYNLRLALRAGITRVEHLKGKANII